MLKLRKLVPFLTLVALISVGTAAAQVWDNTGNNQLNGTYYFRHAGYVVADELGDITQAAAVYGTISFDGNGNSTITAANIQSLNGARGTYSISASGYGFLSNPLTSTASSIYGLVSNGVFVGSSTETGFLNDLFLAVTASPAATNTTFQGTYSIAYMNFPFNQFGYADPADAYDAIGQFTADGQGNIGTVNFTAYTGGTGTNPINLPEAGVRYGFSNGIGTLAFPTTGTLALGGTHVLFISPDGNLIFGGSANSVDFFVGVRKGSAASLGGLYYQAGLSEDASQLGSQGFAVIGSSYGSLIATGGAIIGHRRFLDVFGAAGEDDTYSDTYPMDAAGEYTSNFSQYDFSQDGGVVVSLGMGPYLGINVAVRAPNFSGSGVWLDPTGVRNAASFAPFTAPLARGELLVLTGSGLANGTTVNSTSPFPPKLAGVQVLINNVPAPIYYVTPGAIAAVVPYGITTPIAQVQVVNNGVSSNAVTAFVGSTAPGVLTQGSNGISNAIVQHLDYSLVKSENPAKPGETLLAYVTGLGDVFPTIADGAPGPTDPLSKATNAIKVYIGELPADVSYAGLSPALSGLYAIAFTVPAGAGSGNQVFTLAGPKAFSSESMLPVAGPSAAVAAEALPAPAASRGIRSLRH